MSMESLLTATKADVALITETKLEKNQQINIKGYKWIARNRNKNGGGVGILIRNTISQQAKEDNTADEPPDLETKWITLETRPKNIAIGVFYGPQENEKIEKVTEIYKNLETQILQKQKKHEIILGGDFNAKLKIDQPTTQQSESRNGEILEKLLHRTELAPINTNADQGRWTRVNRKKQEEKSIIDYIVTSKGIAKPSVTIVDEEGQFRIKGKNETDHNTIITTVTTNLPRKKTYIEKWNLANEEGWDKFNKEMNRKRKELSNIEYPELEREIRETMAKTIGKKKIRTDKEPKPNSEEIKVAKENRKIKKAAFQKATKENNPKRTEETLQEYLKAQKNMRATIEEYENRKTEERIKQITNKAKINPNTIWETKKRTRTDNNLAYETITEEGTTITDPQKTKEHIADYFEDLYQARPGTPEYETWTNHIEKTVEKAIQAADQQEKKTENITYKELNKVIKKLKRKKSLGPDEIPNETFIEANKNTREIFRSALNRIHEKVEIPESWQLGHILRLYKGKGIKGKCSNERGITLASNPGKLYERIINERVKKQVQLTEAQAGGIPGSATCDHLTILDQTIQEIREEKKTAYIIFLDVQKAYDKAWLNGILYALNQNGVSGKNLIMITKINTNLRARIHTKHGLTREIKIRDSIRQGGVLSVIEYATLIDEIAKELKKNNIGLKTKQGTTLNTLLWMDDVCLIHHDLTTLQQMLDITNHVAKKYHIEFGAAKCKIVKIGPGQKSKITLNNTTLEEVPKYKYLGKIYNSKGNLEEHLKETESKVTAAMQKILSETGDKEFKGMRMKAIYGNASKQQSSQYWPTAQNHGTRQKKKKNKSKRYSTQQ